MGGTAVNFVPELKGRFFVQYSTFNANALLIKERKGYFNDEGTFEENHGKCERSD